MRKLLLCLSVVVSLGVVVLMGTVLAEARQAVPVLPREVQESIPLAQGTLLTETETISTYVPLVMCGWGCYSQYTDDLADPITGWSSGAEYSYPGGVHRLIPSSTDRQFVGASPDWQLPNDVTIEADGWSNSAEGAFGLVFGLDQFLWEGDIVWRSWYTFVIEPSTQSYWLDEWTSYGQSHANVLAGTSTAIAKGAGTHQHLELRRSGTMVELYVNGVKVDDYDTGTPFTGRISAGVAVMKTPPYPVESHPAPTGYFDNFVVTATEGCITPP